MSTIDVILIREQYYTETESCKSERKLACRQRSYHDPSRQHPEEELFKQSVVGDQSNMPLEELLWLHVGLVAHDRISNNSSSGCCLLLAS